jgi:U3 small nucleolar RNA-associated protein 22
MTKRRKLSHDEDSDSEGSFAGEEFSGFNASEGSDAEDAMEVVDVFPGEEGNFSENDGINNEEDDEGEDDASEGEEDDEDESGESANEPASSARVAVAKKAHKKPEAKLQDGIHTADTFKSNVFKLQVDELLAQVKPKYGKKEAPAENAMRTLKTLIEQLPSRAPLSVCACTTKVCVGS